jgi:hypothetical protein
VPRNAATGAIEVNGHWYVLQPTTGVATFPAPEKQKQKQKQKQEEEDRGGR